jgi:hypothetical protein
MEEQKPKSGSKISDVTWGLLIGAAIIIDIIQVGLDLLAGFGLLLNRFIDIAVGMALPFTFWMLGVKLDSKKILTWIASFLLEEIPIIDALPLWSLDVVVTMAWDKAGGQIEKVIPILDKAEKVSNRVSEIANKRIIGKDKKAE